MKTVSLTSKVQPDAHHTRSVWAEDSFLDHAPCRSSLVLSTLHTRSRGPSQDLVTLHPREATHDCPVATMLSVHFPVMLPRREAGNIKPGWRQTLWDSGIEHSDQTQSLSGDPQTPLDYRRGSQAQRLDWWPWGGKIEHGQSALMVHATRSSNSEKQLCIFECDPVFLILALQSNVNLQWKLVIHTPDAVL